MGCTLCYRPVVDESTRISSFQLRDILDNKFGYPKKLNCLHVEYLKALVDAKVDGADELIEAIRKFECVEIFVEC